MTHYPSKIAYNQFCCVGGIVTTPSPTKRNRNDFKGIVEGFMQSIRYEFPKNLILAVGKPLRIGDQGIKVEEKAINAIPTLTEREQEAIYMRFQQRLTFEEMGNTTNYINRQGERSCYTKERMRQIVNKAIRKMRHPSRLGAFLNDLR